jgi:hypothetical protein
MSSTGEVACFGQNVQEAFLQSLLASNFQLPLKHNKILISIAEDKMRLEFLGSAEQLIEMGYSLVGTPGTADFYSVRGITIGTLLKPDVTKASEETADNENIDDAAVTWIMEKKVDLLINVPEGSNKREEISAGYLMRRAAVDFGCSLITNMKCAVMFADALHRNKELPCKSADEYIGSSHVGYASHQKQSMNDD